MSDYDRNSRIPGSQNNRLTGGWTSGSWLTGIIVAILVIVALGYAFSDRWSSNSGVTEHRASVTDTAPSITPAPAAPAPAASPAATPKP